MQRFLRVSFLALFSLAMGACRKDTPVIIDDWGTSAYARIEGTVKRADGTPLSSQSLFFMCGPDLPNQFGWSPPVATDSLGRFGFNIDVPGPVPMHGRGVLNCRFTVPNDAPAIVSVVHAVRFSKTAETRPLTIVDLIAP